MSVDVLLGPNVLLGPEVEESGRIGEAPPALWAGALSGDDPLALKTGEDAMREPSRDLCLAGEILHMPDTLRVQQQRLSDEARLSSQARRRDGQPGAPWPSPTLKMEEQTGQFDVRVPEPVDNRDAVPLQNLPGLGGGLAGDKEQWRARLSLR